MQFSDWLGHLVSKVGHRSQVYIEYQYFGQQNGKITASTELCLPMRVGLGARFIMNHLVSADVANHYQDINHVPANKLPANL